MDTIIGLGKAGCAIADKFAQYSQYCAYKIDVGLKRTPTTYPIKESENVEDYEENCPTFGKFFKGIEGEVLFVVGGGGKISSACLAVLKRLSNCDISILYIKPDTTFLGKQAQMLEHMVYNVLQEYTRSGVFERMYIVANEDIENVISPVSVKNYFENVNEAIVSTVHMINTFNHVESVTDTFSDPPVGARISTIGFVDPEKKEDQMFFSLDSVSDMVYYYAYNKEKLEEGSTLFSEIKKSIKEKLELGVRATYGIFETTYNQDYIYCINHSSVIQKEKNKLGGLGDLPALP